MKFVTTVGSVAAATYRATRIRDRSPIWPWQPILSTSPMLLKSIPLLIVSSNSRLGYRHLCCVGNLKPGSRDCRHHHHHILLSGIIIRHSSSSLSSPSSSSVCSSQHPTPTRLIVMRQPHPPVFCCAAHRVS